MFKKNEKPNNSDLINTLFGDMKKMDSVIKRLQEEINDVRIRAENIPEDMKKMDSILKELTKEVHNLRAQASRTTRGGE